MKHYTHILFDLDGTLTDPQEGIINSIQYALKHFGIEKQNHELLHFIGPPLHKSFQEFFETEEKAFEAVAVYRTYFAEKGKFENFIYPGIPQLLEQLTQENRTLFVATSKPTIFAEQILHHFNIHHYFKNIIGSNLDGTRTEKKDIIQEIINEFADVDKQKMVMIGDRKFDVIGAKYHKIDSISVTYGYGSLNELQKESPNYFANSVEELHILLK
jgi:phosphoglycolate phosphatase